MGDRALLVELGDGVDPAVNERVMGLLWALDARSVDGILEMAPGYRSLMIIYDPLTTSLAALQKEIEGSMRHLDSSSVPQPAVIEVPVVYGGEAGPDLGWVAQFHGISPEDVIRIHAGTIYRVFMIGFTPGYPYMGELPEALATPRRETPRTHVPRGSVGIAQRQTGIYPVQSPGGWQIIGRTPIELFNPARWPPATFKGGDRVKFIPISAEEFDHWQPLTS